MRQGNAKLTEGIFQQNSKATAEPARAVATRHKVLV